MIFKCKMCGGDLEILSQGIGRCSYCKSVMTLPVSNDERILNLYDRANNLRLNNEFDKASGVYDTILQIDNDQIEAHWGLVLCKCGVEYVDDTSTKRKIPTCHRTVDTSILMDSDFKYVKDNSFGEMLAIYEKEANEINDIQKRILEISSKESPYDVFICYKETDSDGNRTKDSVIAEEIYNELVREGYKVFFSKVTLEDKLGVLYEPYIYNALISSKVMLVVSTNYQYLESVWVKNEWSRYLALMKKDSSKKIIPVYKEMDAYSLPEGLSMYQSVNMDNLGAMQDLIRGVRKIVQSTKKDNDDITEEMYNKMKSMISNEDGILSVSIIKEKSSKLFIAVSFILSFILAICMMGSCIGVGMFIDVGGSTFRMYNNSIVFALEFIVGCLVLISFILGIINRKCNRISKYLYLICLIINIVCFFVLYNNGFKVLLVYYEILLLLMSLLLIKPVWHLDNSTRIAVTEEKKMEIDKKNKDIIDNFKESDDRIIPTIFIVILFIFVVLTVVFNVKSFDKGIGNERDESLKQIKVKYKSEIKKNCNQSDICFELIGYAYEGDIFTVLEKAEYKYGGVYYKIKTNYGLVGYIYEDDVYFLPVK